MKFRNMMKKFGPQIGVAAVSMASIPAFAAGETFDNTSALAWIAAAVVAGIALIGAMIGITTMVGAGKRVQRAGT